VGIKKETKNVLGGAKIAFFLPYKSITRGSKSTLILTIFIMALIFVNIVFISSILLGVIDAINKQSVESLFGNIIIEPKEGETYIKNVDFLENIINGTPGVVGISPHYISVSILKKKTGKNIKIGGWQVKSVNIAKESNITNIHKSMVAGKYLEESNNRGIILGKEISGGYDANLEYLSLEVSVGDTIETVFSNGVEREYKVEGIFSTKNTQADSLAFITEKEMESVLGSRNRASEIIVKIKEEGKEGDMIEALRKNGIVNEKIKPWKDYSGTTAGAVESFDMIKYILQGIAILVAVSTIFIISFVNVNNRKRQIGILKAIGMDKRIIITSYIFQALFYTIVGILVGVAIIYLVLVPYFIKNPLDFSLGLVTLSVEFIDIAISALFLLIAAIVGGYFPSSKVAEKNIIESIWGNG
jgi:putative ABC transport system permease protein